MINIVGKYSYDFHLLAIMQTHQMAPFTNY